jgi:tetratricopeptide (TPR) repeat protein
MEWQDAQAMFYEYAPNAQRDDKVLHQILNCVHRHTLLVELLAKVVQRERTPLSKVLEQLESADLSAHIVQNIKVDTSNHAHDKANLPKSEKIMAYLGFVFQEMNKLTDPQRNALKAFTLLPSMMEIEQNILEVMFEILNINASIDDLKALESLGYISYKGNNTWRTLHPLLSTVAFNELHVDINFATPFITGMVNFLYYDSSEVTHDFSQKQKQQGIGEHLIVRFKNEPTREMMRLYDSIYSLDQASGNNEKAKEHIETALHLAEKLGDAEDIAILQSNLANVYRDLGRYKEAKDLTEKALAFELEHFGEKHPTVVTNQSNLATVYTALGRHAEAEDLLKKALAFGLEYYGEKHQTVAICQNNLADVYHDLGRYKEAAVLKEKALAFELEHYGEKHVRVAISQSNLANVYKALGRHQEAAALLESALASTIANFREKNPMVATIQSNLANVYKALGRHQEAVALLEKALATNIEKFGEKHQTVAICQNNLAYPLWALGNKQRALTLWQSAYENYLSNFGPEHPRTQQFKKTLEYAKGKI